MPRAPRGRRARTNAPSSSRPKRKRYVGRTAGTGQARWAKRRHVADTGIATLDLLALAHAVYRHSQWTSAKAASAQSVATWMRIYEMLSDIDAYITFQRAHPGFGVCADDEEAARDIVAWATERAAMGSARNDADAGKYYGYWRTRSQQKKRQGGISALYAAPRRRIVLSAIAMLAPPMLERSEPGQFST